MKRYSAYKDSGVQWIGEVPKHWEIKTIGFYFTENKHLNTTLESTDAFQFCYGTLVRKKREYKAEEDAPVYSKYTVLRPNDIVINGLNLNYDFVSQRVASSISDGIITSAYICLRPRETTNADYFTYLFKSLDSRKIFHGMGTGIRLTLSFNELKRQSLPIPPLSEQRAIVDYLKDKTSKIDQYVSERERERELLDSLKQSEIANVVTKGLNPNAKMKDSGIPWIGEIPEHWETRKIKYLFDERSEKGHPNEPVLCATQKYGVIPQSLYENRVVVVNKGLEGLKFVKVGDFVISLRSFQGGIEYAYYQGIISAAYTILTPHDGVNSQYLKYLFKSHPFIELLKTCVTGIREGQNINFDVLRKKSIMLPPLSEQRAIVSYIDSKLQKIDQYMADLQSEIDYLKEFKQRLISDAVTGQICVTTEKGEPNE